MCSCLTQYSFSNINARLTMYNRRRLQSEVMNSFKARNYARKSVWKLILRSGVVTLIVIIHEELMWYSHWIRDDAYNVQDVCCIYYTTSSITLDKSSAFVQDLPLHDTFNWRRYTISMETHSNDLYNLLSRANLRRSWVDDNIASLRGNAVQCLTVDVRRIYF